MTQTANSPTAGQKDIPAQTIKPAAPTSNASPTPPAPTPPTLPSEDFYDYEKCTILLVVQIRPVQKDGCRPVLVSAQNGVQNKAELPLYRLLPSQEALGGPLPPVLAHLLHDLQDDLPARKQRHEERAAKIVTPAPRTPQKPVQAQKKNAAPTKSTPPPVPTTSNPVPKEGLVFGGIFDDL